MALNVKRKLFTPVRAFRDSVWVLEQCMGSRKSPYNFYMPGQGCRYPRSHLQMSQQRQHIPILSVILDPECWTGAN